jgi:hypothetical protein
VCCSVYHYFLIIFFALLCIKFCSYCYSTFLITMSLNILHSTEVHKTLCYIKMYLLDIKQNVCAALFALISYYVFCSCYTLNVVIPQSTCTKLHWWIFHWFRLMTTTVVVCIHGYVNRIDKMNHNGTLSYQLMTTCINFLRKCHLIFHQNELNPSSDT